MKPSRDIKWAVASISLGKHPSHTLERKIQAAAANGFQGIELVYNELLQHAASHSQSPTESARQIGAFAADHSITILTINAFKNFEGNLQVPLSERLQHAQEWIDVALALGTRIIQVPSMFLPNSTSDSKLIVSELQALSDLASQHNLTIAYEAVAFAQHNALWQDSLRITKAVNRPNFQICLDSYHVHARIWGDACAADGRIPGGDEALRRSMQEFLSDCPKELVSYVQLSDASRWSPPLSMNDAAFESLEVRDARLLWSRIARPFPLEEPGYFPVVDAARAWLVEYGWDGWVSLEGFLKETEREECGPEVMARRGRESIEKLLAQL
ncbi:uncharacterized protein N0V89_012633 [Didymosphaeria variabile]|uniref:Xylose isomerase-like TIM barrel domain-containing protein n=1 Tax=Didymosphaeria variabile TaxID=1932322 RepID=A0A9W8X9K3_9PLEO|nr:uncharacterized protein N0V89_012633 [Didymosphaeria variabile]KAJ4344888.1 hypothetical protein N0V89_012633 [Didymosphaeria variabile]